MSVNHLQNNSTYIPGRAPTRAMIQQHAEVAERERIEKERLERERIEKERLERERIEKERLERQRIEKERLERQRIEKERLEQADKPTTKKKKRKA